MLGSAVFRTGVAPGGALAGPWVKNELWNKARSVPSLDLRFADNKSLVDATTGQNFVTFTRASSGTYVDSQGVIRTATTNLLLRSEEFDNASWTRTGVFAFGSGSITNAAISPNGTLTADLITEDTSVSSLHRLNQGSLTVAAVSNTVSIYAKRANGIRNIEINANALTNARAVFDLGSGTVGEVSSGTASIQSVGDGWYRCSVTGVSAGGTSTLFIQISTGTTAASSTYTGDGTSGIYLWGAQLEQSNTVGEYIPTTSTINSAPRFDHNPTTGESLGLLVEEARTNLSQQSDNFSDAYWTKTDCTITANESTAPDGTLTANLWTNTASPGIVASSTITKDATARTYTGSLWVKGGGTAFTMSIDSTTTTNRGRAIFNMSSGTLTSVANDGNFTNTSGTITAYANGWYRLTVTTTTSTFTGIRLRPFFSGTGSTARIWGAQVEEGAFPTSHIPTTTATVTRSADVASITGSNFSSWYRQDEGTFFWSGSVYNTQYSNQNPFRVTEGTSLRGIGFGLDGRTGSDDAYFSTRNNTSITSASSTFPYVIGNSNMRICGAFGSDVAASFSGSAPIVSSPAYVFGTENQIEIMGNKGISGTNNQYNGHTRRLTYFPTRLPNETLQRITQ
jgi:hypothetical protein